MDRGRAETHLRQLAQAELRRATAPGALGRGPAGTLPLVAQALIAVGAVDVGTADQIRAEFDLALAARYQAAGLIPQQLARLHGVRPPGPSPRRSPRPGQHHGGWCRPAR
jgi:hypothetical protein